jgi:TRAP-type uncharacterized transport system fused permease subunit
LLLRAPVGDVVRVGLAAALGIAGLAVAFGGWLRGPVSLAPRALAGIAGTTLIHPTRAANVVGIVLLATAFIWQATMRKQSPDTPAGLPSRDGD